MDFGMFYGIGFVFVYLWVERSYIYVFDLFFVLSNVVKFNGIGFFIKEGVSWF